MIAGWLAGKVSGIIIFCVACLSVVLLPMLIVQTIRIDGLDLAGWYVVKGYKPLYEAVSRNNDILKANQVTLQAGLDTCNASVKAAKLAGDKRVSAAQALIAEANKKRDKDDATIAAMRRILSSKEVCAVADTIITTGLQ